MKTVHEIHTSFSLPRQLHVKRELDELAEMFDEDVEVVIVEVPADKPTGYYVQIDGEQTIQVRKALEIESRIKELGNSMTERYFVEARQDDNEYSFFVGKPSEENIKLQLDNDIQEISDRLFKSNPKERQHIIDFIQCWLDYFDAGDDFEEQQLALAASNSLLGLIQQRRNKG